MRGLIEDTRRRLKYADADDDADDRGWPRPIGPAGVRRVSEICGPASWHRESIHASRQRNFASNRAIAVWQARVGRFIILVIELTSQCRAQCRDRRHEPTEARTDRTRQALVERALGVIRADRFPHLATIDGDQPRVRPVSPVRTDGFVVYVANLRMYHKTAEIAANPNVEQLLFGRPAPRSSAAYGRRGNRDGTRFVARDLGREPANAAVSRQHRQPGG